jgi:8-oxo-dGTP pyrophosphatase MutT (NUDIX family)
MTLGFQEAGGCKLWDIPGGRMRRGESIAEAMERELYEEI